MVFKAKFLQSITSWIVLNCFQLLSFIFWLLFLKKKKTNCIKQYTKFMLFGLQNYLFFVYMRVSFPRLHAFSDLCLEDVPGCLSISVGTCCIDGPGSQWDASDWSRVERRGARGHAEGMGGCGRDIPSWLVTSFQPGQEVGELGGYSRWLVSGYTGSSAG